MNRHLATLFAPVAILLLATTTALCQVQQPKLVKPGTRVALAEWKPTQQEVSTSYWSLEPGWNTELEIRNNLGGEAIDGHASDPNSRRSRDCSA